MIHMATKAMLHLLILIFSISCTQRKLIRIYEVEIGFDKITQEYISVRKNYEDPVAEYPRIDDITPVNTRNTKAFQINYECFSQENGKEVIWAQSSLWIEFGQVTIKGALHWFPIRFTRKSDGGGLEIILEETPTFELRLESKDDLEISLDFQFEPGRRVGYAVVDGNITSYMTGPILKDDVDIYWKSTAGKLKMYTKGKPMNVNYRFPKDAVKDKTIQEVFDTNKKVWRRMQITLK